jgi:bifunctional oligoribonuclease and PAP phosphatase NrnA
MKKELQKEFIQILNKPKKVVIIPHKNPDGDALGSTLALNFFLNKTGHQSHVVSPNEYPDFLNWLPGQEGILKHTTETDKAVELIKAADLIFTLDFNSLGRVEMLEPHINASSAKKIMIDHHQEPSDYADIMYSDSNIGSTCEMVYNLISHLDAAQIDQKIATCLYTGIMTDTGSFRFPSTTPKTHHVIAELIDKGANHSEIHQNIYDTFTFDRLRLLGTALTNLKKIKELPVVYITISQEELNRNNFKKGDTEGFVNYGLSLVGISVAVIMIENEQEQIIKMSFRSKGAFSVNDFARTYFNGGGHHNAAGGASKLSLSETESKFINSISKVKNLLQ